ncbi:hypothetical protein V2A60_004991 [Cordyceps javanica]
MVFSGRPSTACHACRPARRKCDRAPKGCSQCRRKGHECPGYPDPTALRMRNETTRVTLKQTSKSTAHAAAAGPRRTLPAHESASSLPSLSSSSSPSSSSSSSPPSSYSQDVVSSSDVQPLASSSSPSVALPLQLSTELQAVSFLFHTFIAATPFEGYLPSFYLPGSPRDDACACAIDAAALAAYARHARRPRCADAARERYADALSRVNAALADPRAAVHDRTLVAVLVLALFEATVFQAGTAPTSWVAHTWGAMQLLMLRGPHQLAASPAARQLFAHTSNNVKASCIQRSAAIPPPFLAFDEQVRGLLDSHDPAVRLADLLHKVSALKARSRDEPRNPALLLEALRVDRDIIAFCDAPPPSLRFDREPPHGRCGPAWTFRRIVHAYPNLRLCKVWNAVRLLRIFLLSFLADDIEHFRVDETLTDARTLAGLRSYARAHMADVAVDVLATVPSFVHTQGSTRTFLAPGRCLGWPLGILEMSSVCPPDARLYARKTLEWLAEDLNLPQAIDPERHPGSREDW